MNLLTSVPAQMNMAEMYTATNCRFARLKRRRGINGAIPRFFSVDCHDANTAQQIALATKIPGTSVWFRAMK